MTFAPPNITMSTLISTQATIKPNLNGSSNKTHCPIISTARLGAKSTILRFPPSWLTKIPNKTITVLTSLAWHNTRNVKVTTVLITNLSPSLFPAIHMTLRTSGTKETSFTEANLSKRGHKKMWTNSRFPITTKFFKWFFSIKRKMSIVTACRQQHHFPR